PFSQVELDVDLKLPGYEARVVEALQHYGLVERTLISTMWMRSLIVLRELEPRLRLGWSVPRLRNDPTPSCATTLPAAAAPASVATSEVFGSVFPRRQRNLTTPRSTVSCVELAKVKLQPYSAGVPLATPTLTQPESASSTSSQPSPLRYWTRKRIDSRAPFGV